VFYRILAAPPGYGPDEKYMVAAYETLEYTSCVGNVKKADSSRFAATLEEARTMLPGSARHLPSEPDHQFLELWACDEAGD